MGSMISSRMSLLRWRQLRARLYLFGITALAVFLVAITVAFLPDGIPHETAVVIVRTNPEPSVSAEFTTAEADQLKSSSNLKIALEAALADAAGENLHAESNLDPKLVEEFQERLAAAPDPSNSERLTLSYAGWQPIGPRVLNKLAQQFVDRQVLAYEMATQQYEHAKQLLNQTQSRTMTAQSKLKAFVAKGAPAEAEVVQTPTGNPPAAPQEVRNPRWEELHNSIVLKQQHLESLLGELTPVHPAVLELKTQIADLVAQLQTIPEMVPADLSVDAEFPVIQTPSSSPPPAQAAPTISRAQWQATREALEHDVHKAGLAYETARTNLEQAEAERRRAPGWQFDLELANLDPPARPNRWPLGITSLGLALVLGGWVAVKGAPVNLPFLTLAQTESALALPVLAVLPATAETPPPPRLRFSRGVQGICTACEVVLILFLFWLVLMLMVDTSFFSQLLADPFAAFPESLWSRIRK